MYASLTTPRETPRSDARTREAGRRSPSTSRPERIAARSWSSTWRCNGPPRARRPRAAPTCWPGFQASIWTLHPGQSEPTVRPMRMSGWIGGALAASLVGASFPVSEALVDYPYAAGQAIRYLAGAADPHGPAQGPAGQADAEGVRAAVRRRRGRHGALQPRRARHRGAHRRDQRRRGDRRQPGGARAARPADRQTSRTASSSPPRWSSSPAPRSSTAPTTASTRSASPWRSPRSPARSASRCWPRRCSRASARCASPPGRAGSPPRSCSSSPEATCPRRRTRHRRDRLSRDPHHRAGLRPVVQAPSGSSAPTRPAC